jgi:hypothetical protein
MSQTLSGGGVPDGGLRLRLKSVFVAESPQKVQTPMSHAGLAVNFGHGQAATLQLQYAHYSFG